MRRQEDLAGHRRLLPRGPPSASAHDHRRGRGPVAATAADVHHAAAGGAVTRHGRMVFVFHSFLYLDEVEIEGSSMCRGNVFLIKQQFV